MRTPPEMTCGFLIQLVFCKKKIMWFIGVEVEQETSAPTPPKKILDPPLCPIKCRCREVREVFYSYLEKFSYFTYKISLPLANTYGERSSGFMIMTYACVQPPPALRKNLRRVGGCTQAK